MKKIYLDFENSIKDIEDEINQINKSEQKDKNQKLIDLNIKLDLKIKDIYSKLSPAQITMVARHPNRPYTLDYVSNIFDNYEELNGDRMFADDKAIVGGLAEFNGKTIIFVGHQKGRNTKDKLTRNFGMPRPEGFRKALRLFKFAEKFNFPIITFIDTAGAYPGIGAEERGQSEAIGRNLYELSSIKVPVICNIIGEGGSGGALAIAVGDYVNMLEYSIYSVISPEGCSSILWKTADKASVAAKVLGITSQKLFELKIIDKVINEPLGGAHRNHTQIALSLKSIISEQLDSLLAMDTEAYLKNRFNKIMQYGNI